MAKRQFKAEFELVNGPMDGHVFEVCSRRFKLGRGEKNEIALTFDESVEEEAHLEFWADADGQWNFKNRAKTPVLVDGQRTDKLEGFCVGHVIKIGRSELMVTYLEPYGQARGQMVTKVVETSDGRKKICQGRNCCALNDYGAKWCKACGRKF